MTDTASEAAPPQASDQQTFASNPAIDLGDDAEAGDASAQFITFRVGDEEYGVDIMRVREIKGWSETTQLPNSPPYMRGVLNLRGTIVPIYDLRSRFGLGDTDATPTHVVVIVAVRDRLVGILVDAVSDILTVASTEIRPVPETDRRVDQTFLTGLVSNEGRMVALLALEHLFAPEDAPGGEQTEAGAAG